MSSYNNNPSGFEITCTTEPADFSDFFHATPDVHVTTSLKVDDISGLPNALKELAKMGVDLSATAEALRQIEEERRVKEEQRVGALMAKLKEKAVGK